MAPISGSRNIACFLQKRVRGDSVSFVDFKADSMMKNLQDKTIATTVFQSSNPHDYNDYLLKGFDVKNKFVATIADTDIVKVWNVEKKTCHWVFNSRTEEARIQWLKVKIAGERVICSGIKEVNGGDEGFGTFRIFNLQTGEEIASVVDPQIDPQSMYTNNEEIFFRLPSKEVRIWNFEGELVSVSSLNAKYKSSPSLFKDVGIVHYLGLPSVTANYVDVDRDLLIFGHKVHGKRRRYDFSIFDLKTHKIINRYEVKEASIEEDDNYRIVTAIACDKKWIYLGYSNGAIVAFDLVQKKSLILGKHSNDEFADDNIQFSDDDVYVCDDVEFLYPQDPIRFLTLDDQILISGSFRSIKIWDTRTMALIKESKNSDSLNGISLNSGKLSILHGPDLIQYDFLASNSREEIIADHSSN